MSELKKICSLAVCGLLILAFAGLLLYLVREGVGVRSGQALSDFYALAGGNMRYIVGLGLSIWIGMIIWPNKNKASAKRADAEKE